MSVLSHLESLLHDRILALDGGVDLLLIETIFDTLNAKAAVVAVQSAMAGAGRQVPIMLSGTITDASGRTLSGQTVEAFWHSLAHIRPLAIGLNCALGAEQLRPYVEQLSRIADTHISTHPNAGLPDAFGAYNQTPEAMASALGEFAESGFVNLVGGCCGTTPDHIAAICDAVAGKAPRTRPSARPGLKLSGLEPLTVDADSLFVNIGERTNVTGSARFSRLIREDRYDEAVEVARQQVQAGAQMIDVNMDEGMLDSRAAMTRFLRLIMSEPDIARVPVMIDSSKWEIIESGLECVQGKAVVNSIRLKEGEEAFIEAARGEFAAGLKTEYAAVRKRNALRRRKVELLSLEAARENKLRWSGPAAPAPAVEGIAVHEFSVNELEPYIDWTPFFMTWQLAGKFPRILEDEKVGASARELFDDAQAMLETAAERDTCKCGRSPASGPAAAKAMTTSGCSPIRPATTPWPSCTACANSA